MEIWRNIKEAPNYMVSNMGNIKNSKGKILKPQKTGYKVNLNYKNYLVHRLVAQAFPEICGEWFDGCEIDHLDTEPFNNQATNLKICTRLENQNNPLTKQHLSDACKGRIPWDYGLKFTDTHKENISNSLKGKYIYEKNPNSKAVVQLSKNGDVIKVWSCIKKITESLNVKQPSISSCCCKNRKTAYSYKWQFVDDYLADWWEQEMEKVVFNDNLNY